ncbi:MAG: selenium-dependent xanthine dehydrogenase [Clostridia bacterium]|nr:selenium-dependent xanthine dehydrogenase [Clostridia bacterium]
MYQVIVNGTAYECSQDKSLLRFLRDDLRLTSVKDGCSQGICGTCTVLIDGRATKSCVMKLSRLAGKSIVTIEGFTPEERELYVYAFAKAGAVQCGFCTPGMVIAAKALLDVNPCPTRAEAAKALRFNLCRCTGYKKIIDAVLLAAELKRNGGKPPQEEPDNRIGEAMLRVDAREKILGTGRYPDDVMLDGMIYGSAVRSKYPRARVLAIHTEKALELPGVIGVWTADDIPGQNKVGHLKQDWDTMIPVGKITHYLGDAICLVAAETPEILAQAKELVEVEYEELKCVFSPTYAAQPFAPLVHESGNLLCEKHVSRGNADEAIRNSDYVLMYHYETPYTEHAFMEPECAVAYKDDDGVAILSADQSAYDTARETSIMLGIPQEKVHVTNLLVGGGFGGKEDVTVQHHAALIAWLTGRPVKVKLSREESILVHPKRHPMKVTITMGTNRDGIIQGVKADVTADTGAYASLGGPVLERACTHAAGPYNYSNFEITGKAYYTNNPPAGAFRGFGVTQTCFAMEMTLTKMAHELGISPWEIRYRNAIRPGQTLPNGQIAPPNTGLVETLEAVKDIFENNKYVGLACAMKNAGVGVGIPDTGRCILAVQDGKIHIRSGASCIGQGLGTVLTQIVGTMLGCSRDEIVYEAANNINAPDSGTTSGSRQTLVTGEACRRACQKLLLAAGAEVRVSDYTGIAYTPEFAGCPGENREGAVGTQRKDDESVNWKQLEGREFYGEYLARTDALGADKENPVSHVSYGYATQVCILNEDGKIQKIVAAHDVGKAINPQSCEGQIEGGVVMALGFTLTEHYPLYDCIPSAKLATLGLFRADQVPDIQTILIEKPGQDMACGAIGIGEITTIPTAPAVAGAYFALDGEMRTSLPLMKTPYERAKIPRYWW